MDDRSAAWNGFVALGCGTCWSLIGSAVVGSFWRDVMGWASFGGKLGCCPDDSTYKE